jgi:hypothetical protein
MFNVRRAAAQRARFRPFLVALQSSVSHGYSEKKASRSRRTLNVGLHTLNVKATSAPIASILTERTEVLVTMDSSRRKLKDAGKISKSFSSSFSCSISKGFDPVVLLYSQKNKSSPPTRSIWDAVDRDRQDPSFRDKCCKPSAKPATGRDTLRPG